MIPDYSGSNPYQRLLADGLERSGATVAFPRRGRRLLPVLADATGLKIDVVHLHWINPYLPGVRLPFYFLYALRFLLDLSLTRLRGTRVVWTIHNKLSHEAWHPRIERLIRRVLARLVDARIVHSAEIQREISTDLGLPPAAFEIVPHASYANHYGDAMDGSQARHELGLEQAGRVFLNFGLMRPYKGVKRLLEAWAASGLGDTGNVLVFAGDFNDPNFRHEVEALAATMAGVRFDVGHVPDDRVRVYFSACDAVALPFEKILTSGSLHLALAFGKPIVAPRLPSISEILGSENPFAFDPADANSLGDALRRCADADLADSASNTEHLKTALHDWDSVARATFAIYEQVARVRSGSQPRVSTS